MKKREIYIVSGLFIIIIVLLIALIAVEGGRSDTDTPENGETLVGIETVFNNKVVYTTDSMVPLEPLMADCAKRGGVFNECGSICGPEAEMCATVCAFTCELELGEVDTIPIVDPVVSQKDMIQVREPQPEGLIGTPLTVQGEARGMWYFEASFPIFLVNWNGLIIAEGYAQAQGDWMTEDFVPFVGTLEFENPYTADQPDFMQRGAIIFKKDNPTGLPEHDDAYEMTVYFEAQ